MKLFYAKGACSMVCRIVINELGLDCEYESVNLQNKTTESGKDFLTINSKGYVPALQLDNGHMLTENTVILQYLADTHHADNLLPAVGHFERYYVLEWLNFITTELHKGIGVMFNPALPQNVKDEIFIPAVKKKLSYVNNHLEHSQFLAGDHFMLPDAYLFVMLLWCRYFNINIQEWSHIARYFNELSTRPSVHLSMKQEL